MGKNEINIIVAILGGLVLVLGLGSKKLEKHPIPATLVALLIGILLGPEVLDIIDPATLGGKSTILEHSARLVLGIGLVSVALRIPKAYPRQNWRQLILLIGLGMLLMWGISTLLVYLILGIPFWLAALIGAIIAPTDPIAASPIVTGPVAKKNLPERLRNAISFESGANDGLSYLFVFLPLLMLTRPEDEALSHWLTTTLLWEVLGATVFGLLLGYVAAKLLNAAEKRDMIQKDWRLVFTVALSLLAVGAGRLIKSDEVLVVFAAGAAFVQVVTEEERGEEERGQEAVNRFFSYPIFALLGTAIPWSGWHELGWSGLLLVAAVLLLRRPPVLLLLKPMLPSIKSTKDALFLGWFGPVAVAAIYYASMAEHKLKEPLVWDVVSLVICASVVIHGISSTPLSRLYGKSTGYRQDEQ
ncbi:cation:proton antiporter domain-containing protein [Pontibacter akesuensis]|uniref:Sodium/proton antiporter, CPA1 family n=1 Tax=Pontibacter akesuensis TaxID=388950 RepID=A0A1I7GL35_9BACT|nr:cation:proton antiporter [Pontibacter akesuensis]GHA56255.1 cation transporter [Pontibacter akesuensis]SFU49051.1 sodium/proton antiporter, CPA1 family [Pontibacter akesuensis]